MFDPRPLIASALFALVTVTTAGAQEAALTLGRAAAADFNDRHIDALWQQMTPDMQSALGEQQALKTFRDTVGDQLGAEAEVLSETTETTAGMRVYVRISHYDQASDPIVTRFAFDAEDRIAGFFVRPQAHAAESRFLDYTTQASLRLPFDGAWYVYWGGRTPADNYHVVDVGQRFASDFLIKRDGTSHSGDGMAVEDYHCWGEPVLAPATGTVAAAVDGLADQRIGERDPAHPAGNHVVLDLGEGEYAFLAHLQKDSVAVNEGETVESGAMIGRCGNSGNSSEPHLHFHLQTTPDLGRGEGLPAAFVDYVADGEPVERGEPVRGQHVEDGGSD